MYAYLRLLRMMARHLFTRAKKFDSRHEHVWVMRPGLNDIDVYPEVNNGRHFVLFDLARYEVAMKIGLFRWVRKTRSAFVVAGSTIRYRHRLLPWRRTEIHTQLVGMDERFFYFHHKTVQRGKTCSIALVRTGVRRNGVVPPTEVMDGIGMPIEPFMEPWVAEWNDWDSRQADKT